MMTSSVVVVGSGDWQESLWSLLNSLDLDAITVGPVAPPYNPDNHLLADVRDCQMIKSLLEGRNIDPIAFMTSQTDVAVKTVALLNFAYGITAEANRAAEIFTDKYEMRKLVDRIDGLSNPKYSELLVDSLDSEILENLPGKYVVKPKSLQSSLGVKLIDGEQPIFLDEYRALLKQYKVESLILEEFIDGIELTVEGYKDKGGRHRILAVSKKNKNIGFGVANSLNYSVKLYEKYQFLDDAFDDLFIEYPFGPTHTELICQNDKVYLVEAAVRGGGSNIPSVVVPHISGCFPERDMIKDQLGTQLPDIDVKRYNYVTLEFFRFVEGSAFTPIPPIGDQTLDIWINFETGQSVKEVVDDRSRHGYVIIGTESQEQLESYRQRFIEENPGLSFYD